MNRIFFSIILLLAAEASFSQIRTGVAVTPQLHYLSSGNLNSYYEDLDDNSSEYMNYEFNQRLRTGFGLGGFIEYKFSPNIYAEADLTLNFVYNKFFITAEFDSVGTEGTGYTSRAGTTVSVNRKYLYLPLLGKFHFHHRKRLFAMAGLAPMINFSPRIKVREEYATTSYFRNESSGTTTDDMEEEFKAENYSSFGLNLVVGFGKVFNPYGNNILIDIRYSHPLLKGTLSSGNQKLYNESANAWVFSEEGSRSLDPKFRLDDFKSGMLVLSIKYSLYKNYR